MSKPPDAPQYIAGVSERDIDLLLLEEFMSSKPFRAWFLKRVGVAESGKAVFHWAQRSVTQSTGESDLEVAIETPKTGKVRVLIENKVNAGLQPKQAERYKKRAANYIRQGECQRAVTVIAAPASYFHGSDDARGFDQRISYEDLTKWFLKQTALGGRRKYKADLLRCAIQKGTLGYQLIEDDAVSDFWSSYWQMAIDLAPELQMRRPGKKPSGSGFVYFFPASLPAKTKLVHKLAHGNVDLQFAGMAREIGALQSSLKGRLEPGMGIVKAAQSACVRLRVPELDPARPFGDQAELAREGLREAKRLMAWATRLSGKGAFGG